jgi:hypothetical protein
MQRFPTLFILHYKGSNFSNEDNRNSLHLCDFIRHHIM